MNQTMIGLCTTQVRRRNKRRETSFLPVFSIQESYIPSHLSYMLRRKNKLTIQNKYPPRSRNICIWRYTIYCIADSEVDTDSRAKYDNFEECMACRRNRDQLVRHNIEDLDPYTLHTDLGWGRHHYKTKRPTAGANAARPTAIATATREDKIHYICTFNLPTSNIQDIP